jgi:cob(I)alamin adenosyltransferase
MKANINGYTKSLYGNSIYKGNRCVHLSAEVDELLTYIYSIAFEFKEELSDHYSQLYNTINTLERLSRLLLVSQKDYRRFESEYVCDAEGEFKKLEETLSKLTIVDRYLAPKTVLGTRLLHASSITRRVESSFFRYLATADICHPKNSPEGGLGYKNEIFSSYLNKLSDYLYSLAKTDLSKKAKVSSLAQEAENNTIRLVHTKPGVEPRVYIGETEVSDVVTAYSDYDVELGMPVIVLKVISPISKPRSCNKSCFTL